MSRYAKQGTDFERDLIPQGPHKAVCSAVYIVGHQWDERYSKWTNTCIVSFEFPELRTEFEKDGVKKEGPRVFSKFYNVSLDERSNMYKDLILWRGKSFTKEELKKFDLENLVGVFTMAQIIHETKPDGKIKEKLTPMPALFEKFTPELTPHFYDVDEHLNDPGPPDYMPEWISKYAQESREIAGEAAAAGHTEQMQNKGLSDAQASNTVDREEEEDVPF